MRSTRLAAWSLALVCCAFTSGCATTMYSPTRDAQGKALKEAWGKVDLSNQIAVPRKNRAAILTEQLAAVDRSVGIRRDALVRGVATAAGTQASVRSRLDELDGLVEASAVTGIALSGGAGPAAQRQLRVDAVGSWLTARKAVASAQRDLGNARLDFDRLGVELPDCVNGEAGDADAHKAFAEWEGKPGHAGAALAGAVFNADKACAASQVASSAEDAALGRVQGQIAAVRRALSDAQRELGEMRAASAKQRQAVQAALDDGQQAAEQGASAAVATAANTLKEALDTLAKAGDAFSIRFLAAKRQEAVDNFLAAVAAPPAADASPPAGTSRAAMALVLYPELFDDVQKQFAAADRLSLAPLVLSKELARITQEAAARDIAIREARIALLQQKLDLLGRQAKALLDVDEVATKEPDSVLGAPVQLVLGVPPDSPPPGAPTLDDRVRIWKAFTEYIDAGTRLRGEIKKLDHRLVALDNEQQLDLAESNVSQWNTLVGANIDQMAAYGASGVKAEQITALINSLALVWIGSGVNK